MSRAGAFLILVFIILISFAAQAQQARVQFVHNSPDTALRRIDLYLDGVLIYTNMPFRKGTAFYPITTAEPVTFDVRKTGADPGSTPLASETYYFNDSDTSILILEGVSQPTNYPSNPDGKNIQLQIIRKNRATEQSRVANSFEFFFHNGVVDAPETSILLRTNTSSIPLVQKFAYGDTTNYLAYLALPIAFDFERNSNQKIIETFIADLTSYKDSAGLLFYSGLRDTAGFGKDYQTALHLLTGGGKLVPLTKLNETLLQIIHNSADTAIKKIDVYADTKKVANDLEFRKATVYLQIPANQSLTVSVANASSTSVADAFYDSIIYPVGGVRLACVTEGVLNPSLHSPNPDNIPTGFGLSFINTKGSAFSTNNFDAKLFHGVTDLKAVDISANNDPVLTNASFTFVNNAFQELSSGPTLFEIRDSTGSNIIYRFTEDYTAHAGKSGLILLSGFQSPASAALPNVALITVLSNGTVLTATDITGVEETADESFKLYPNPAKQYITILLPGNVINPSINIYDLSGRLMASEQVRKQGNRFEINVSALTAGVYILELTADDTYYKERLLIR